MAKASALLKAYLNSEIPLDGGFIISSFFDNSSTYSIYEVTAYKNVKDIFQSPEGLTFKTDGNRVWLLVEPATYAKRFTELVSREDSRAIPYRFSECTMLTTSKQDRVFIPNEPKMLYSSFTILQAQGDNFSYIFYPSPDVYMAIKTFIADSLYNDCGLRKAEATEASDAVLSTIKKFTIWH